MLLTATTAKERDDLGADIDKGLSGLATELGTLQQYVDTSDAKAVDQQKKFAAAVGVWSGHLRDFVTLVKAQPLDLSQMNWQVGTQDVSLLVETGKLELVDELVAQRGTAAKATIEASGFIFHSSFVMIAVMTVALIALAFGISEWVVRRLAGQLGGEPAYAKEIASRIAAGDLSNQIVLGRKDKSSMLYALHDMQSGLATTVSDIASSADAIATASGEISMGNLDRSAAHRAAGDGARAHGEQHGAVDLHCFAQNADNAKQASTLANNASAIAEKGGDVVSRVVATMNEINDSARSIGDIIGVIEGIAFQTNILALNATAKLRGPARKDAGFRWWRRKYGIWLSGAPVLPRRSKA